jgi:hypothetical protein
MEENNFCLIKKNKIYEDLYEILEDEELIMDNPQHKTSIKYKIEKLIKSYLENKVSISNNFETSEQNLEEIMLSITTNSEDEQGNTLLMFANSNYMYEVIFMEKLGIEISDDELNQLVSISNVELSPIYGNCAIVKTSYRDGELKQSIIKIEDLIDLFTHNFYHMGVMINPDNSMQEIEFTGENPNLVIGGNFKMLSPLNLFGLTLVGYLEKGETINKLATKIYGNEIKGRFYLAVMCPITNKKFWSIDKNFINNLTKLIDFLYGSAEEKKKIEELEKELNDDKLKNPFFLIKKYCV